MILINMDRTLHMVIATGNEWIVFKKIDPASEKFGSRRRVAGTIFFTKIIPI